MGAVRMGRRRRDFPAPDSFEGCWSFDKLELVLELRKSNLARLAAIRFANFRHQIIAVITPYLVGTNKGEANLGAKVFFLWGSLCCVSLAFAYLLVVSLPPLSERKRERD